MKRTTPSGPVVWLTGLSGSGKTTICNFIAERLTEAGERFQILDGDEMRVSLCRDLGFSLADRLENIRRISHAANLLSKQNVTVLVATISPTAEMREMARSIATNFIEVFVDAPISVCEARDPKGLYRRAREGEICEFTGIDACYERPTNPDVVCATSIESVSESAEKVLHALRLASAPITTVPRSREWNTVGRRPTIAVDFDGVIANYAGWKGESEFGVARSDVIAALHQLAAEGWKVIVHTTRAAEHIIDYLRMNDVPYDEINRNSDYFNAGAKPVATVYWDDRALRYSGDASTDLHVIREFRTWNGRS